jgi:hypothetical protein
MNTFINFHKKTLFIQGIKTLVIGLRDNNGIVDKLAPLDISTIEQATVKFLITH